MARQLLPALGRESLPTSRVPAPSGQHGPRDLGLLAYLPTVSPWKRLDRLTLAHSFVSGIQREGGSTPPHATGRTTWPQSSSERSGAG